MLKDKFDLYSTAIAQRNIDINSGCLTTIDLLSERTMLNHEEGPGTKHINPIIYGTF